MASGMVMAELAEQLLQTARAKNLRVMAVESCTGGMVVAALTDIAGSSDVVWGGVVTYDNTAKMQLVDVPEALLIAHGAVSAEVAFAMAEGALARYPVDAVVSITGIAGPSGGSAEKPVGLVYMAVARKGEATRIEKHQLSGDRAQVREQARDASLNLLQSAL